MTFRHIFWWPVTCDLWPVCDLWKKPAVHSEVRRKTTEGQYCQVHIKHARIWIKNYSMALENQKIYMAYDCFHGNGWYGQIPAKREPIRMLWLASRQPCHIIMSIVFSYHLGFQLGLYLFRKKQQKNNLFNKQIYQLYYFTIFCKSIEIFDVMH